MKYESKKIASYKNEDVFSVSLINDNNFKINFYNFGGHIHQINIPYHNNIDKNEDVVLGYGNFNDCLTEKDYFNFIIGRVCNRISNSKFIINDKVHKLYANTPPHHLHGGKEGFNKKIWKINNINENKNEIACELEYLSPHLEENYPGNLQCKAIYSLNNNNELKLDFHAISDCDTIVNITNHNYWNFHGHGKNYQNITNHSVQIKSKKICEIDNEYVPTGNLITVNNTKFDLNNHFSITQDFLDQGGIDHNYALQNNNLEDAVVIAYSELTGMGVEYYTNQKGVQFYSGNMMQEKYNGKYSKFYGKNYGMCFETQNYPDSINQSNFPSTVLNKNEKYHSQTIIKLMNNF